MNIAPRATLLPCPFCGGEADIHHMPDGAHAQCYECEANSRIFDGSRDGKGADREFAHEDAFEAWNQRHRQSSNAAGVGVDWAFVRACVEEAHTNHVGYHRSNMPGEPDASKYDAALAALAALASLSTPTAEPMADLQRLGQEYDGDALREALEAFGALLATHDEDDGMDDFGDDESVGAQSDADGENVRDPPLTFGILRRARRAYAVLSATPPAQEGEGSSFSRDWCINMARKEGGYDIGAGEVAIDPIFSKREDEE